MLTLRQFVVLGCCSLLVLVVLFWLPSDEQPRNSPNTVNNRTRGRVIDPDGNPIAGARVRVKGVSQFTSTDAKGRFVLSPRMTEEPATITASKSGYYIGGESNSRLPVSIRLEPLPEFDNPEYRWVSSHVGGDENCENCHQHIHTEWSSSGHAHSAENKHFMNIYGGTDWHGRPGHGWSLLDDYPDAAGVCASCHAPSLAPESPAAADLRLIDGVAAEGVHCDFCHKVYDAPTDAIGVAHGVHGLKLLRPGDGQVIFGPLDDVDRGVESYAPVQSESRYCASCHEGVVLGVHVYSTYSEWLQSPARAQGKQCQACHMTPSGKMTNIAPGAGGIERDPLTLASHTFMPGGREAMLRRCVEVSVSHRRENGGVLIDVTMTANDVGHRVPTGFIDRHLILLVNAYDSEQGDVPLASGPTLPRLAGETLASKPGYLFAKYFADSQLPVPFWRAVSEPVDTRLHPEWPHVSHFEFPITARTVRVQLLYRRFWQKVKLEKSWPSDEIVVYDKVHSLDFAPVSR